MVDVVGRLSPRSRQGVANEGLSGSQSGCRALLRGGESPDPSPISSPMSRRVPQGRAGSIVDKLARFPAILF
jgi:hypothetical protein